MRNSFFKIKNLLLAGVLTLSFSCSTDEIIENPEVERDLNISARLNSTIQAEDFDNQNGVRVVNNSRVGFIENGDWIRFDDFDYDGANSISVQAGTRTGGGTIEIRTGSPTRGDLLGTVNITNTGGFSNFETFTANINDDSSNSDLYLTFVGGSGFLLDIDSFSFSSSSSNDNGNNDNDNDNNNDNSSSPSGTNVAVDGEARQSSTGFGGSASRAIDGNTSGNYGGRSVTHTQRTSRPWWEVTLEDSETIEDIVIFNRTDNCCVNRLSNFNVSVLNSSGDVQFQRTITNAPTPSVTISTGGVVGNRVRVQLNGTEFLSLAEVQVFSSGSVSTPSTPSIPTGGSAEDIIGGRDDWKLNGYTGTFRLGREDNGLDYADDASFENSTFFFEEDGYAVFRSYAGNPSSGGSSNSRSELREQIGGGDGFWDGTSNTERSMKWRVKVDNLPPSGNLCFGQIHERNDRFDDVIRVQAQGDGGQSTGSINLRIQGYVVEETDDDTRNLDFDMRMDTEYYFELTMRRSVVRLYELDNSGNRVRTLFTSVNVGDADENYFKAGAYLQTTRENQFGSNDYGQISIRDISVSPND